MTSVDTLSTLTNIDHCRTENTSFPNFDILDKKTHKYISQPLWDHKASLLTILIFSNYSYFFNYQQLAIWTKVMKIEKYILFFACSKISIRDHEQNNFWHTSRFYHKGVSRFGWIYEMKKKIPYENFFAGKVELNSKNL